MQYLGGKHRIAKQIVTFLESVRKENQVYFEPFVGAANIVSQMSGQRIASDNNEDLILLLKSLQNDSITLPDSITEEDYLLAKTSTPSALRAFIGIGCSFSGKWFGGFARSGSRNYCLNAKNSLLKKKPGLIGVNFLYKDYKKFTPEGCLIYNDPPYRGTTGYKSKFNNDEFWEIMRVWSVKNDVYISEYTAPSDFECVLEIPTKTDLRTKNGKEERIERLFARESSTNSAPNQARGWIAIEYSNNLALAPRQHGESSKKKAHILLST